MVLHVISNAFALLHVVVCSVDTPQNMESGNRKEDQRYENEVKLEIYNRGEGG